MTPHQAAQLARIDQAISKARGRRDIRQHLAVLQADKERLLARGTLLFLTDSRAEEQHRWLTEYRAICRLINEDEAELGAAA